MRPLNNDFMFQLTKKEFENQRFQIGTFKENLNTKLITSNRKYKFKDLLKQVHYIKICDKINNTKKGD